MNVISCIRPTFTQDRELVSDKNLVPGSLCSTDSQDFQLPPSQGQQHSDECHTVLILYSVPHIPVFENTSIFSGRLSCENQEELFKEFVCIRRKFFSAPDSISEHFSYSVQHRSSEPHQVCKFSLTFC